MVIEAESRVGSLLDRALTAAGYDVERISDGRVAVAAFASLSPDVVLLDLTVPGLSGLEVARRLRAQTDVPIICVSALDSVPDRVAVLDAGADDFVPRPFAIEELLARLRAVRRGRALAFERARRGVLRYSDIEVDLDARQVSRSGRRIELRHRAFELLAYFLRFPERVLSKRELLEDVWGYAFLGDSNVIEVTVSHIRQALEAAGEPRLIHTVRPVGYILHARAAP